MEVWQGVQMRQARPKTSNIAFFSFLLIVSVFYCNALPAAEGDVKWQISPGGGFDSSPAIGSDGTIYVGSLNGNLYALSSTGTLRWTFTVQGAIHSSPAIGSDGTIYFGSDDTNLYAINSDGSQKWVFSSARGPISSSPAIGSDGTLYVGSEDGNIYAVTSEGGSVSTAWPFTADSAITTSPAIATDGTVYVGSRGGTLYAILSSGALKWDFSNGNTIGNIYSSPAIGSDGTIYFGASDAKVYAVTAEGSLKWPPFEASGSIISSPAIRDDGSIVVGSNAGIFYALNKDDGSEVWAYAANDKEIRSSPLVASDGTIYFGSYDEKLHAINGTGSTKWERILEGMISASPTMGFGGDIYIGTETGNFYAVETVSVRLASGSWPSFHHDVRHTGRNNTNLAPTANAGSDQTAKSGKMVTLYGSSSSDPDYGIPFYQWSQTEGETVELSDTSAVRPSFSAPETDSGTKTLTFQLLVTDNGGLTSTDTVQITVEKNDDDGGCFIRTISR
jgi:outer membrane protein assembly factor BamB